MGKYVRVVIIEYFGFYHIIVGDKEKEVENEVRIWVERGGKVLEEGYYIGKLGAVVLHRKEAG